MNKSITIDIEDWVEELNRHQVKFASQEDIFELSRRGFNAGEIARMAIAARENGKAPDDILKANKLLLYSGARYQVGDLHAKQMLADLPVDVRQWIGQHFAPDDGEDGYVETESAEGQRLATEYLLNIVPGHVTRHMRIVAVNGGDCQAVAGKLIERIRVIALETEAQLQSVPALTGAPEPVAAG